MLDCHRLDLSSSLAATRMEAAKVVIGEVVLRRIIAFTLFILGVNRTRISEVLDMPPGTVRSLTRRVLGVGVKGFFDQRRKASPDAVGGRAEPQATSVGSQAEPQTASDTVGSQAEPQATSDAVGSQAEPQATSDAVGSRAEPQASSGAGSGAEPQATSAVQVTPGTGALIIAGEQIHLPEDNPIQRKVVLLSLIGEGMLSAEDVAPALGLSSVHVSRLHRKLMASDVEAVLDKRRGRLEDYRVDSELKGKMILAWVLELAECGQTSGAAVARRLEQCDEDVPERTVRHHLGLMGLTRSVRDSLKARVQQLKKRG